MSDYPELKNWRENWGSHQRAWNNDGEFWYGFTLWEAAKDLKPFDLPLAAIPFNYSPWDLDNIEQIAYHVEAVNKVDFKYPIILDSMGSVLDGHHRIVKALIKGMKTIKAVRILDMPPPDGHKEQNQAKDG